jgi:hypothetical protein
MCFHDKDNHDKGSSTAKMNREFFNYKIANNSTDKGI